MVSYGAIPGTSTSRSTWCSMCIFSSGRLTVPKAYTDTKHGLDLKHPFLCVQEREIEIKQQQRKKATGTVTDKPFLFTVLWIRSFL